MDFFFLLLFCRTFRIPSEVSQFEIRHFPLRMRSAKYMEYKKKHRREHLTFTFLAEKKKTERKKNRKKNGTENKSNEQRVWDGENSSCDKTTKRNFWICLFYHLSVYSFFFLCVCMRAFTTELFNFVWLLYKGVCTVQVFL